MVLEPLCWWFCSQSSEYHWLICTFAVVILWGEDLHPEVETWRGRHKEDSQEIGERVYKCCSLFLNFFFFFTTMNSGAAENQPTSLAWFPHCFFSLWIFSPWITATNIKLNSWARVRCTNHLWAVNITSPSWKHLIIGRSAAQMSSSALECDSSVATTLRQQPL